MGPSQLSDDVATSHAVPGDIPGGPAGYPSVPGYELDGLIGRGGMGDVYRARDLELDREVAVKILRPDYPTDSPAAARFLEEARITGPLQHPSVPAVYRVSQLADGRPFLAMKLIRGRTLDELLRAGGAVNRLAVIEAVAQAVGYAHAHGVIHRDLKPQNVMVGAFGEVQVMDWGLAKVVAGGRRPGDPADPEATAGPTVIRPARDSDLTLAGSVLGTPSYMPPEQAAGEAHRVGPASDVFGLGALWCRVLTGQPPFTGADAESVRRNALRGKTEAALARLDGCGADPEAVSLCKQCLAVEPEDRPADANAVAAAVAGLRVAAEDRARAAELAKVRAEVAAAEQAKRRRLVQWAAGAVAAVLLLGLAGTGLGLWPANAASRDADAKREAAEAAEARAAEQRAKAEEESALATAVQAFLQFDVLLLADPVRQQREGAALRYDADVRLRDVVLRAAEKIDGKFADRPLIEAELRYTLGYTLRSMGRPDQATRQYERVGELRRAHLGPDHPDTLMAMHQLATAYEDLGREAEALALREDTLARRKARLGPDHPDTLATMNNLAFSYSALGRQADALELREQTLARRTAVLGPDHPHTFRSMNNLALSYSAQGRHADALRLHQETLALRKARLGPDHPDTLQSRHHLAKTYAALGRHEDALQLFEETVALQKVKIGRDHQDTLASMHHLAFSYTALGRHADALALHRETLGLQETTLGPDHPDTLDSEGAVIAALAGLRRPADAVPRIRALVARADAAAAAGKRPDPRLVPAMFSLLAQIHGEAKDAAGCRAAAGMWEQRGPKTAGDLYQAARLRAVAAAMQAGATGADPARLASDDAARAVAWLTRAVDAGWADRHRLEEDADLDCLRGRDDFKRLVERLPKR